MTSTKTWTQLAAEADVPAQEPSTAVAPSANPSPEVTVDPLQVQLIGDGAGGDNVALVVAILAAVVTIAGFIVTAHSAHKTTVAQTKAAQRSDLWNQINWSVEKALSSDRVASAAGLRSLFELLNINWLEETDKRRILALAQQIVP